MRIALVSANATLSPYPVYPLGLSMIAAALTTAGHKVAQMDYLHLNASLDALGRDIEQFEPDLVGISVRNIDNVNLMNEQYYVRNVRNIVDRIRAVTDAKVILGGAGFSLVPDLILKDTGADYGVIGEGEGLMVEFANDAEKGIYPRRRLLGPAGRLAGGAIGSALYDERLLEFYLQSGHIAPIQTKRGCAHKCVYCSYPVLEGPELRRREPTAVVDDIVLLRDRFRSRHVFFVDSVFNDDEGAYLEVIDEMLRRGVSIPWSGFIRPGGLTDEIVERMRRTGFTAAEVGADAACDRTLRTMGKGFTFDDIAECNGLLVRHGIAVSHFVMFGGPGETEETVHEGIMNVLSLQECVVFVFMGIRILPGTPLARIAVREKLIGPDDGLLHPRYYLSPHVDKKWLEAALIRAFEGVRHCVFPPDAMDHDLRVLHRLGCTGPMWDRLLPGRKPGARTRQAARQFPSGS